MKLYEPSLFITDYNTLTFTGVTDPQPATDNDKNTVINSSSTDPVFDVDFGSGETRTANSLWLRSTGFTEVAVQYGSGNTELVSEAIPADGYLYLEFTEQTARRWRLAFTGTGGIYEVYLSKKILDLDVDGKRPLSWRIARYPGIFIRAANNDLISFQPFGFGGGRATITLVWELLDNASVALLESVWRTGVERNRQFGVFPVPDDRPRHFFQAQWNSEFAFKYAGRRVADGQSGSILFQERDISL